MLFGVIALSLSLSPSTYNRAGRAAISHQIVRATAPRFLRITAKWNVRGGIYTNVVAEHRQKGWQPPARGELP